MPKQVLSKPMKRYSLVLPEELFQHLDRIAEKDGVTLKDVLRRFIKIGLYLDRTLEKNPEASFIIRDGNEDKFVELLF